MFVIKSYFTADIYRWALSIDWRHNEPDSLKSPASRWFAQTIVQAQIKEGIKAPRRWPLWGEITSDRWIPLTKG